MFQIDLLHISLTAIAGSEFNAFVYVGNKRYTNYCLMNIEYCFSVSLAMQSDFFLAVCVHLCLTDVHTHHQNTLWEQRLR